MAYQVKICGITNRADLEWAARAGADYGGAIVEVQQSPRSLARAQAEALFRSSPLPMVAVTLDRTVDEYAAQAEFLNPAALQLHGSESPEMIHALKSRVACEVWKAVPLPTGSGAEVEEFESLWQRIAAWLEAGVDRFVIDAAVKVEGRTQMGGTGCTVDWSLAGEICRRSPKPVLLAGGITPENAARAVETVNPAGIDVSSGVEMIKGKKDPDKVLALILAVRAVESRETRFT